MCVNDFDFEFNCWVVIIGICSINSNSVCISSSKNIKCVSSIDYILSEVCSRVNCRFEIIFDCNFKINFGWVVVVVYWKDRLK